MGVNPKIGGKPPKWMVKIIENPIKMDDLGCFPYILWNSHIIANVSRFDFVTLSIKGTEAFFSAAHPTFDRCDPYAFGHRRQKPQWMPICPRWLQMFGSWEEIQIEVFPQKSDSWEAENIQRIKGKGKGMVPFFVQVWYYASISIFWKYIAL